MGEFSRAETLEEADQQAAPTSAALASSVCSADSWASFLFETCRESETSRSSDSNSEFGLTLLDLTSSCSSSAPGVHMTRPKSPPRTHVVSMSLPSEYEHKPEPPATTPVPCKPKKSVQFLDETELNDQHPPPTDRIHTKSHYATPSCANMVVKSGSLRRFSNDEVELFFSQDLDQDLVLPVSMNDFALQQLVRRTTCCDLNLGRATPLTADQYAQAQSLNVLPLPHHMQEQQSPRHEMFLCGTMQIQSKLKLGGLSPPWKNCYGELFPGILFLGRWHRNVSNQRNPRTVLPIDFCSLKFANLDQHILEIECSFQDQVSITRLRFESLDNLFLWYFAIQLMTKLHLVSTMHEDKCRMVASGPIIASDQHFEDQATQHQPALDQPQWYQSSLQQSQQAWNFLKKEFETNACRRQYIFPRSYLQQQRLLQQQRQMDRDKSMQLGVRYPADPLSSRRQAGVTHLILVRHGEAENIQFQVQDKEKPLTLRGRRQAKTTAQYLARWLRKHHASGATVKLVYGNRRRVVETAQRFFEQMPFLTKENFFDCCFITEGAPKEVGLVHRVAYREALHRLAFELLCQFEPTTSSREPESDDDDTNRNRSETYRIVICHASFIQFALAESHGIPKELVKLGAPIGHCAMTQLDLFHDGQRRVCYMNRISHLSPIDRTTD